MVVLDTLFADHRLLTGDVLGAKKEFFPVRVDYGRYSPISGIL
jgi:hypothetical protein